MKDPSNALPVFIFGSVQKLNRTNSALESDEVLDVCKLEHGNFAIALPREDGSEGFDMHAEVVKRIAQRGRAISDVAMVVVTILPEGAPLITFTYK